MYYTQTRRLSDYLLRHNHPCPLSTVKERSRTTTKTTTLVEMMAHVMHACIPALLHVLDWPVICGKWRSWISQKRVVCNLQSKYGTKRHFCYCLEEDGLLQGSIVYIWDKWDKICHLVHYYYEHQGCRHVLVFYNLFNIEFSFHVFLKHASIPPINSLESSTRHSWLGNTHLHLLRWHVRRRRWPNSLGIMLNKVSGKPFNRVRWALLNKLRHALKCV